MTTWYGYSLSYCRALLILTLQTLFFNPFEVIVLFVSVLLVCSLLMVRMLLTLQVNYLISDGKSHWLEGVLLMTMYLIIAVAAWYGSG